MKRVPIPSGISLPHRPTPVLGDRLVILDGADKSLTGAIGTVVAVVGQTPHVEVSHGMHVIADSLRASWARVDAPVSPGDWVIPIEVTYPLRGTQDVGKLRQVAAYLPDVKRVLIKGDGSGTAFVPRSVSSWAVVRRPIAASLFNGWGLEATSQFKEKDFDRIFDHHAPNADRAEAHASVRRILKKAAQEINALLPDGDEKEAAIYSLEDAMFRANAAIARAA